VPASTWETDRESEWFPVLADRISVATVQGSEWLPNHAFEHQISLHDYAWTCGQATSDCLEYLKLKSGQSFSYVFLPATEWHSCCDSLLASLRQDRSYRVVHDASGGTIFEAIG
jgi:hypothetical protein